MALRQLITCVVAGLEYLVHPQILGSVEESVKADQIIPVMVRSEAEISRPDKLQDILEYYVTHDDVCSDDFTGILVVKPSDTGVSYDMEEIENDFSVYRLGNETNLPSGPYFLSGPNLHQAWRIYQDDLDAFTFGMVPEDVYEPQRYQAVPYGVPVPSRFYHPDPTPETPLSGARVAVKDIYDVEGVPSILSSRAWTQLYPESPGASAGYVSNLARLGAVVVGKTKTTQFSSAVEWVDFHSPINPRGDLYQEPSGSSTGAAAALAGYNWLDYSIGEDSDGDAREPAARQGLYSLRPSFGSASMEGVKVKASSYDTVGLFGRSLDDLLLLTQESLDIKPSLSPPSGDVKLLYPTDSFLKSSPNYPNLTREFIGVLETYLDTKHVEISLGKLWNDNPPPGVEGRSLEEYMEKAPFWSHCYEYYNAYNETFIHPYAERFGKQPFVEASPKFRWNIGAKVSREEYEEYRTRIKIFREWFSTHVMTGQDAFMLLPYGISEPEYRDVAPSPPKTSRGINPSVLPSILETPHLVIPFAQIPYQSRVSGFEEYLPVCGSVMGPKGSDSRLISLVKEAFVAQKWPTKVDTGRFTFKPGDETRLVEDDTRSFDEVPALRVQENSWQGLHQF